MRSQNTQSITTETTLLTNQKLIAVSEQLFKSIIYAGLGSLGGALGVAFVIGLSILFVLLAAPPTTFSPSVLPLSLVAILMGLGISWWLNQTARRLFPNLFCGDNKQALQVIFIFSILTSLLETFLFGQGL